MTWRKLHYSWRLHHWSVPELIAQRTRSELTVRRPELTRGFGAWPNLIYRAEFKGGDQGPIRGQVNYEMRPSRNQIVADVPSLVAVEWFGAAKSFWLPSASVQSNTEISSAQNKTGFLAVTLVKPIPMDATSVKNVQLWGELKAEFLCGALV